MTQFKLKHDAGKLLAHVTVDSVTHEIDVTRYFEEEEEIAEWLFFRRKQRRNKE